MKDITKHYDAGDVTIIWKPAMCIHAAECVKALPKVYDPKAKPWITPEHATDDEIRNQVAKCPSGALSIVENNQQKETTSSEVEATSITVAPNGPLLCKGKVEVRYSDGTTEIKDKMTAFCRCGASSNKPYCDGSHNSSGFKG